MNPEKYLSLVQSLPEQLEPEHVGSQTLAPLFSYVLTEPLKYKEGFTLLKDKLLDLTIRMAKKHAPYYTNRIGDRKCWTDKDLDHIEPIDKTILYKHQPDILSAITTFGFVTFTTGTTNQPPLLIERSQEEQLYLQNFFGLMQGEALKMKGPKPLGIVEGSMNHGSVLKLPGVGYSFMIELTKDYGIIRTAWLLQNEFNFDGYAKKVMQMQTTVMGLCYLHQYLTEQGVDFPKDQLKSITIFGWPVPKTRRAELEAYFGVQINDNYSMSEMFGGARYCHACDAYHFDPFVHPELIDLETSKKMDVGTGELVLTPLFPFTQRFVLIRYKTGDLVEVKNVDCQKGEKAYIIRGRLKRSLRVNDRIRLGEAEVAKALDEIREINRAATHFLIFKDPNKNNWPLFKMTLVNHVVELKVELTFDLNDKKRTETVKNKILQKLMADLPQSVQDWLTNYPQELKIIFCAPGSLEGRDYWNL